MNGKTTRALRTALMTLVAGAAALGLASPAGASAGPTMYGDPAAAAKWWRLQKYDDCVLMASADVIGQMTGTEPSERAVIKMAESTPSTAHPGTIYITPAHPDDPDSGHGTNRTDIPTLLGRYGIGAKMTSDDDAASGGMATGMEALEHYLRSELAVIVSVNAEMIWGVPIEARGEDGYPVSDHALVVTGVDTFRGIVHLNDSGIATGRDEQVPLSLFDKAWATGHHFLVVTGATVR